MSSAIIKVENLSKCYRVGHLSTQREQYTALRDVIVRNLRSAWRKTSDLVHGRQILQGDEVEDFWALKDVSFEIQPGEVVGIIGRNGAGKSTLLKILSRITEPTGGRITLNGRVASLLEVGTGFHPELSGRENVYLNGAILGMTRAEIKAKFDEIVDFAGVEKFLDTPVKRYSSGMYVRLAFAVSAHLEPEILIVDEVLAVGDAEFQKKCLGKMKDVSKSGKTVLFVSHNLAAVSNLCTRGILLKAGQLVVIDTIDNTLAAYSAQSSYTRNTLPPEKSRQGTGEARITALDYPSELTAHEPFNLRIGFTSHKPLSAPDIRASIYTAMGVCVSSFGTSYTQQPLADVVGDAVVNLQIPSLPLNVGHYSINVSISTHDQSEQQIVDRIEEAARFNIISADPFKTGRYPAVGTTFIDHSWHVEQPENPAVPSNRPQLLS